MAGVRDDGMTEGPTVMQRHVLGLAREAATPEGIVTAPRLDGADSFDHAFEDVRDLVLRIVGHDGMPAFLHMLEEAAMRVDGPGARTSLAFLPAYGSVGGLSAMLADDRLHAALSSSLARHGLVARGTCLTLSRSALEPRHLVELGPGALRRMAREGAPRPGGGDPLRDAADALLPGMGVGDEVLQDGVSVVGSRALALCATRDAGDGPDWLDRMDDPRLAGAGAGKVEVLVPMEEPWLRDLADLGAPYGVAFDVPTTLSGALAAMARHQVLGPLSVLRAGAGIPLDAPATAVHYRFDEDRVTVLEAHGDVLLGPVDVPMLLVERDPDAFAEMLAHMGPPGTDRVAYPPGAEMPEPSLSLPGIPR